MYLVQSQKLQAEGPATAFMLLAVGAALMWRKHPTGLKPYCFAILSALALCLGILTKLFDAYSPIVGLVASRACFPDVS
jgi:hypothetical protein